MRFFHLSAVLASVLSSTVDKKSPRTGNTRRYFKDDFRSPVRNVGPRGRYDKDEIRSPDRYAQFPRKKDIATIDNDVTNDEAANLADVTEETD